MLLGVFASLAGSGFECRVFFGYDCVRVVTTVFVCVFVRVYVSL